MYRNTSLEAAASRFEDIAVVLEPGQGSSSGRNRGESTSRQPQVASVPTTVAPPAPKAAAGPPAAPTETLRSAIAFKEQVIDAKLAPFVEFTKGFAGPNVVEIVCTL